MATTWTLMLLRHAKSSWDYPVADHDRPLSDRGRRDARAAGRLLAQRGWVPDLVLCSTAVRARQTWERALGGGAVARSLEHTRRVYAASAEQLLSLVSDVDPAVRVLLLVGHAPGLPDLADRLGRRPEPRPVWKRMDAKYPTAGLAVLAFPVPWADAVDGELVAFEVPRG